MIFGTLLRTGWDRLIGCVLLAAFAVFSLVLGYSSLLGIDLYHDGLNFKSAHDIAAGLMRPGEEYSQYGSLFHAINALALKLTGGRFAAIKLLTAFHYAAALLLLYLSCLRVAGSGCAILAALVYVWLCPLLDGPILVWASAMIMSVSLLITYLMVQAGTSTSRIPALAAGALTGSLIFVKVNVGLTLSLGIGGGAVLAWLLRFNRREPVLDSYLAQIRAFGAGWAAAVAAMFAYLAAIGALGNWLQQHVLLPRLMASFIPEVWYDRPNDLGFILWCLFPTTLPFVWTLLPIFIVLLSAVAITLVYFQDRLDKDLPTALTLCGIAGGSWAQYYPVPDVLHTWWAAMPMLPALALALSRAAGLVSARHASLRGALGLDDPRVQVTVAVLLFIPWLAAASGQIRSRTANLVRIDTIPALRGLAETQAKLADLQRIDMTIRAHGKQHGPARVATLAPNPTYSVLAADPTNWSHAPSLHALYLVGPSRQPEDMTQLLRERAPRQLIYSMVYSFHEPAWRPLTSTSDGGLLLEPGIPSAPSDLAAPAPCAKVETHASIAHPQYNKDPTRFWGYLMPPIRTLGPVSLEMLVSRRKAEGPNSVILDALLGDGPPQGFQIRRHKELGDPYFLTETVAGKATPLIPIQLTPERINHLELRHAAGGWEVYLDGARIGTAPSRLTTLAAPRMITLGAGRRYIDSFVGEVVEWRVADTGTCAALPPPDPSLAPRANTRGRVLR